MTNKEEIRQIRKRMESLLIESAIVREAETRRKESLQKVVQEMILLRNRLLQLDNSPEISLFLSIIAKSFQLLKLCNEAMQITGSVTSKYESLIEQIIFNTPLNDKHKKTDA